MDNPDFRNIPYEGIFYLFDYCVKIIYSIFLKERIKVGKKGIINEEY